MTRPSAGSTGRVVLVSGGGGAIGTAVCEQLHAGGWTVAIGYVTRKRAEALAERLSSSGPSAVAVPLDLTSGDAIDLGVTSVLSRLGRVDAAVFVGGVARTGRFLDSSEADWGAEIEVNLLGPMRVTRLCLPVMIASGGGALVGITSEAAKFGDARHAAYSAAKAGLSSFFKTLVREHGRDGIRASCVAPGPIDTPMMRYPYPSAQAAEEAIARRSRLVPLRRMGRPHEVAFAVQYLVSDDASYVAGEHLSVGGGVSMQ